jgi:hypothetical protein
MGLDELKSKLNELVRQYSITKFDVEDIIELVAEGESIDWIVSQLEGGAQIDTGAMRALLTDVKNLVGTPQETATNEVVAESPSEPGISAVPQMDSSELDLSHIEKMLPPGMEMPPGLNAEELKSLLGSPQGKVMADFFVFCQQKGFDINGGDLSDPRIERLQSEWAATPRDAFEGKTPAEMLSLMQGKIETFRREEPRVGRNDPCPCGSGKKFKKCCGR